MDKGVEILAPGVYSPMMLLTHKGVRTAADFQGQKVRTQGGAPIQVEPFKKLGVLPVSLPLGEALPAMQNRTIDGMIAGVAPFTAFKYYDIAKPMTYLPSTTLVAPILVNRQFMKSLGPELEAIVREEGRKAEGLFTDWNVADHKQAEAVWRKNGAVAPDGAVASLKSGVATVVVGVSRGTGLPTKALVSVGSVVLVSVGSTVLAKEAGSVMVAVGLQKLDVVIVPNGLVIGSGGAISCGVVGRVKGPAGGEGDGDKGTPTLAPPAPGGAGPASV